MPLPERHQLILSTWKQHPLLGPSQIKNQLRRQGYKASVNTVRNVMEEHSYVTPKIKRKEHTGSYEAVQSRQLYQLDFFPPARAQAEASVVDRGTISHASLPAGPWSKPRTRTR